jgi:hypothetical protein
MHVLVAIAAVILFAHFGLPVLGFVLRAIIGVVGFLILGPIFAALLVLVLVAGTSNHADRISDRNGSTGSTTSPRQQQQEWPASAASADTMSDSGSAEDDVPEALRRAFAREDHDLAPDLQRLRELGQVLSYARTPAPPVEPALPLDDRDPRQEEPVDTETTPPSPAPSQVPIPGPG